MKRRKKHWNRKKLPYGFKMKTKQKYPRNALFSYQASKRSPNKAKKICRNYSYKNFSYSNSYRANFAKSLFWGTQFEKTTCKYCMFNNAKFVAVTFINCNFRGSKFKGTIFQNCLFKNCKLPKTSFSKASFEHTFFVNSGPMPPAGEKLPSEKINQAEIDFLFSNSPSSLKGLLEKENLIRLRETYTVNEIIAGLNLMDSKKIKQPALSHLFKFIELSKESY
ncbi:pentapeptide repeat-containing protein [Ligilactobacillus acidipiscis]|uniref:pentapeptide repeat-containing protein n=1 Tax=Ligilactobacillus acidipiscis TaxID=89059 RepID=UPI0023F945C9|nr:pentapeptide repeat-containing protein [Ligilactobacillus acidipiscis]WEV57456.1 pentapeptide repeat-containing protein [Ligilactobacillus acidipiscis]